MRLVAPLLVFALFAVTSPAHAQFGGMPVMPQVSSQGTSATVEAARKQAEAEAEKNAAESGKKDNAAESGKKDNAAESGKKDAVETMDKNKPAVPGQ